MGDESLSVVAAKAMAHYHQKEYAAAVRTMQKLMQNQDEDFKVAHNIALAEYKLGDCKQPQALLDALRKAEQDAMSKTEDGQDVAALSIMKFNQAVLLTQLKQYPSALTILEQMYANIQSQEDQVGFKVCFLLLDLYFFQKQGAKAAKVLEYLSAPNTFTELSKRRNEDLGSEGLEAQLEKDPENATQPQEEPSEDKTKRPANGLSSVQFRFTMHLYQARLHLLNRNFKSTQKEIKAALQLYQKETKQAEKAEGEAKATNNSEDDGSLTPAHASTAYFLRSNLEYMRSNYLAAIKLLNSCMKASSSTTSSSLSSSTATNTSGPSLTLYYNNLGCIHFRFQKFTSSGVLFTKSYLAAAEHDAELRAKILYNIALQQSMEGNPQSAFACLQLCRPYLTYHPVFWFRCAECCLKVHQQQRQQRTKSQTTLTLGSKVRRLMLTDGTKEASSLPGGGGEEKKEEAASVSGETPTLEHASRCLRNALYLLSSEVPSAAAAAAAATATANATTSTTATAAATTATTIASTTTQQSAEFSLEKEREGNRETLRMACLLSLMYTELSLDNPVSCVRHGTRLLALKNVPPMYRYFAHMYSAEALCALGAPDKALRELLIADKLEETANPYHSSSPEVNNPHYLKAALYCNLATTRIAKGELVEAQECVNHALSLIPDFKLALKCSLYLQLRQGDARGALTALREKPRMPLDVMRTALINTQLKETQTQPQQ